MPDKGPLLPSRAVWTRFGVTDRTLDRWIAAPKLNFPRPTVIRKRRYWYLHELEAWELECRLKSPNRSAEIEARA
jgi:hypothetical protein